MMRFTYPEPEPEQDGPRCPYYFRSSCTCPMGSHALLTNHVNVIVINKTLFPKLYGNDDEVNKKRRVESYLVSTGTSTSLPLTVVAASTHSLRPTATVVAVAASAAPVAPAPHTKTYHLPTIYASEEASSLTNIYLRGGAGQLKDVPPSHTAFPMCELTAMEIFCFCPLWIRVAAAMCRLKGNGWGQKTIAEAIASFRPITEVAKLQVSLTKDMNSAAAKQWRCKNMAIAQAEGHVQPVLDISTRTWARVVKKNNQGREFEGWNDCSLLSLLHGLTRQPTGHDRGVFTQCIEYAVANNDASIIVSNVAELVRLCGFRMPVAAPGANRDAEALERFKAAV